MQKSAKTLQILIYTSYNDDDSHKILKIIAFKNLIGFFSLHNNNFSCLYLTLRQKNDFKEFLVVQDKVPYINQTYILWNFDDNTTLQTWMVVNYVLKFIET